jgi:hypothetical protein
MIYYLNILFLCLSLFKEAIIANLFMFEIVFNQ